MKPQNVIMRPKGRVLNGTHDFCKYVGDETKTLVEIGSFAGEFAEIASKYFGQVWCIDPWLMKTLADGREGKVGGNQKDYDCADYEQWWDKRCGPIGNIVKMKGTSPDFLDGFPDGSVDCVYIDSIHTYETVMEESSLWTPKIQENGWLCGHDYHQPMFPEVTKAVDELSKRHKNSPKTFTDTSWAIQIL